MRSIPRSPAAVRRTLQALGIRPSKGRGQNFLLDRGAVRAAVEAAELGPDRTVLEVGPGLGILTEALVATGAQVVAVEVDPRLARWLREALSAPNLTLLEGDVLTAPPVAWLERAGAAPPYRVVANLPYSLTSPLLAHFLERPPLPEVLVLMLQREVAQRLVARPPRMTPLAVGIGCLAEAEVIRRVPRGAFWPVPEVESALVRIVPRRQIDWAQVKGIRTLARTAFRQARKQLRSGLAPLAGGKTAAAALLEAAGIDPTRRPETLSLEEWDRLARVWRSQVEGTKG